MNLSCKQKGFSLIEVMIAFVVLAFGVLGLALIQAQAIKFNNDSYWRSQASVLAYDLIERIRMNPANVAGYEIDDYSNFDAEQDCQPDQPSGTTTVTENDLNCWQKLVSKKLPTGKAKLTQNATGRYVLKLNWIERLSRELESDPDDLNIKGVEREQTWTFLP